MRVSCLAWLLLVANGAPAVLANDTEPQLEPMAEVLVLGSRIRRAQSETVQPVLVIDREAIARSGLVSVGDVIQDLVSAGAALNTSFNNGGNGEVRADLRNLGDSRTLVLLNGRRLSTTLDGAVDLSVIPLAIVDRIEVLRDGASALYGSDAIAGVINIHTLQAPEHSSLHVKMGGHSAGDGAVEHADVTFARAFARGQMTINLSHTRQHQIMAGDRALSAVPVFGAPPNDTEAGASPFGPNGRFGFGPRGSCAFNPTGNYPAAGCRDLGRVPPVPATTYDPSTGSWRVFDRSSDGYNFAPDNYLQTPYERSALFGQARFELSSSTALSFDALANQRRSAQQLAASPFMLSSSLPPPQRHIVPVGHVYNPFAQPVNLLFLRPGGQLRRFEQDSDTLRLGVGLDGSFELGSRAWIFDINLLRAQAEVSEIGTGNLDLQRLLLALGPSYREANGLARCGTPVATIADCVPLDPFRGADGISSDMRDYLYFDARERTRSTLNNVSANLSGDLYDLPAGPLALATGLEYRREHAQFAPDERLRAGNLSSGITGEAPLSGATRVTEAYVEFSVPLLAQVPLAHALDLSLATRYSDYACFGGTTNSKAGLRWAPIPSLAVRGNFAQGFRAPNLAEQFTAPTQSAGAVLTDDPCNSLASPGAVTRDNCRNDGVPTGVYEPINSNYLVVGGGNRELLPEYAIDRTLGVVYSPAQIAGLDLSLDWYRIEVADAISTVSAATILNACALQAVPEACARTARDPISGELLAVDARRLNSGTLEVEGFDFNLRYALQTDIGRFDVHWDTSYVQRYITEVPRGVVPSSRVGNYQTFFDPSWRLRSNLDLSWSRGAWISAASLRYYSDLDEACPFTAASTRVLCSHPDVADPAFNGSAVNHIPSALYVDLQLGWTAPWQAQLRLGLHNAFDRDPPIVRNGANSFDPAYPLPGRYWYFSYLQRY